MALGLFFALGLHRYFTLDTLRDNREALQRLGRNIASPLRVGRDLYARSTPTAVAISFPGASILTIFWRLISLACALGVPVIVHRRDARRRLIIFLASKTALGDVLQQTRRQGSYERRWNSGFHEDELNYMFLSCGSCPVFPFWAINIAAGVLGVSACVTFSSAPSSALFRERLCTPALATPAGRRF